MYKLYKTITLIIIATLVCACGSDFLERYPESSVSSEDFYNTVEEMRLATAPLYTQTWFLYNDKASFQIGDGMGGNVNSPYGFSNYVNLNIDPLDSKLKEAWQSFYTVIGQANTTINALLTKKGAGISEADIDAAVAEARFMRAVAYFYLVRLWGPVIIIEDNIDISSNPIVPLNPVEDVYRFIMNDLEFAAGALPEKDVPGRVTSWSAKGMLAKVYLVYSGYNNQSSRNEAYLSKAKELAADVCRNSEAYGYKLADDYADLFFARNNNNPESLFALQWIETNSYWGQGNPTQAYLACENFSKAGDGWNMCWASYDMLQAYSPADTIRRNATFMTIGTHYPELYKSEGGYTFANTEQASCKKYVIGSSEDAGVQVYIMSAPINTYMLRLSDVYLTYAEAVLGNDATCYDAEALQYLNRVRTRAGLPAMQSFTLDDIYYERRIEFAMEGQFWYDLVARYYFQPQAVLAFINNQHRGATYTYTKADGIGIAQLVSEQNYPPVATAESMQLPYPETEVISNPLLKESPVPYDFN